MSTDSAASLARRVAARLDADFEVLERRRYANDQFEVHPPNHHCTNAEVFLFQAFSGNPSERLLELVFASRAVAAQRPARLTAVLPYLPYSRSDRPGTPGGLVPFRIIADLLQNSGVQTIVTVELHHAQLAGAFRCPVFELPAVELLARQLIRFGVNDAIVVSPDLGGVRRAERVAKELGTTLAIIRQERRGGSKKGFDLIGRVQGYPVILVDDEINTGETILSAVDLVLSLGATEVYAAAPHGLFTQDCLVNIQNSAIRRTVVTDSIPKGPQECTGLDVVSLDASLATMLGEMIS
jgi:ribose-phosphate pyrophosphokinase